MFSLKLLATVDRMAPFAIGRRDFDGFSSPPKHPALGQPDCEDRDTREAALHSIGPNAGMIACTSPLSKESTREALAGFQQPPATLNFP
jgi:hypothetical protein